MTAVSHLGSLAIVRPDVETRVRDGFLAVTATGWLGYTYFYPGLHLAHTALPACPFLALTGHPCPFCGGTRSFSAAWRGDLGSSLHHYPLGPLLFAACFAVAAYALVAVVSGRSLRVRLAHPVERLITAVGVGLLSFSWALKLLVLGN